MSKTKTKAKKTTIKKKKYYEAVGRRKTSIARVRLFTSSPDKSIEKGNLTINGLPYKEFFPLAEFQKIVESPFECLKSLKRFNATVKVKGGGTRGQAEAIRHGISRTLVLFDANFRKKLKKVGYLTRDSRKKERKKFGLKKARRGPQWSKR
jgi:small subunit ribosomal protein S9